MAEEIVDLIDELAAERLPEHLTEAKRAERAEVREEDRRRQELERSVTERLERTAELTPDERSQLREDLEEAWGPYSPKAWEARRQLDQLESEPADVDGDSEVSPTVPQPAVDDVETEDDGGPVGADRQVYTDDEPQL